MFKFLQFLFLFISIGSFAQTNTIICGTIQSTNQYILQIYEPINGYNNSAFYGAKIPATLLNKSNSFYKKLNIQEPAFFLVCFTGENAKVIYSGKVLLLPGDSVHIDYHVTGDGIFTTIFTGSNSAAQKLYNDINLSSSLQFKAVRNLLNKTPLNTKIFLISMDSILKTFTDKFDNLQKSKLCTKQFETIMASNFKALLNNEVLKKFSGNNKELPYQTNLSQDSIINVLFSKNEIISKLFKSLPQASSFINNYYQYLYYKKHKNNSVEPIPIVDSTVFKNKKEYLIKSDFVPFLHIENEQIKQDLWAIEILEYFNFLPGKYDETELIKFNALFPHNRWRGILRKQFENKNVLKKIQYQLTSPVIFIDSLDIILNLTDLLNKLPTGRAVYIDLWASWCTPCIAAYSFNKPLDSFLLKHNIEKLYISLDKIKDIQKWKQGIQKYALGGYHYLVNENLKASLKKEIYKININEGMPIPRYLLVDKNKKVVVADAYSPIEFSLLTKQITSYLLK